MFICVCAGRWLAQMAAPKVASLIVRHLHLPTISVTEFVFSSCCFFLVIVTRCVAIKLPKSLAFSSSSSSIFSRHQLRVCALGNEGGGGGGGGER